MTKEAAKTQLVKLHIEKAKEHLNYFKQSFRWKSGSLIARVLEKVLLRKKTKLSIEVLEEHLDTISKIVNYRDKSDLNSSAVVNLEKLTDLVFLVSDNSVETSIYGDTHVANDFKAAFEKKFKMNCSLIQHHEYRSAGEKSLVIAMLWDTVLSENDPAFKIAWIRNYPEKWMSNTSFILYDVVLCSSSKILQYVKSHTSKPVYLFPIAANTERFMPSENSQPGNKICFVGNKFIEERSVESIIKSGMFPIDVYGSGWEGIVPEQQSKGTISNTEIPKLYSKYSVILDTANATTLKWESLNSRVFNAIASKRIVLTDSESAASLFKSYLPVYKDKKELQSLITGLLGDAERSNRIREKLFEELQLKHNYHKRLDDLELFLAPKISIAIKITPTKEMRKWYGDLYYAQDLSAALEKMGHQVRIDSIEDWHNENSFKDDLVILLRGLKDYKPNPEQINVMWLISHPEDVKQAEMDQYDHIFVASEKHCEMLKKGSLQHEKNFEYLAQCTNSNRFYPIANTAKKERLLFVGNSRNVYRNAVKNAIELGLEIDIFGSGWEEFIDSKYILADFADNSQLVQLYNGYDIVLNDHWDDMKQLGYLSNRIFDAAACNATVLSDQPLGMDFNYEGIYYFSDKRSFAEKVEQIRNPGKDKDRYTALSEAYYQAVNYHSFDEAAGKIIKLFRKLSYERSNS